MKWGFPFVACIFAVTNGLYSSDFAFPLGKSSSGPDFEIRRKGSGTYDWGRLGTIDEKLVIATGFSVISNFAKVVPMPQYAEPPTALSQLKRWQVGSPKSPVDIFLIGTNESQYNVGGGYVFSFWCPGSYFKIASGRRISEFGGTATIREEQAILIASNVVQRLAKVRDWWANCPPVVIRPSIGASIPFYMVRWPHTGTEQSNIDVEIDGRTGKVVSFFSMSSVFYDLPAFKTLERTAFTPRNARPDLRPPELGTTVSFVSVEKQHLQQPTTEYVAHGINTWLWFCSNLSLNVGNQTNIADVDWDRTWLYTNEALSATSPVCQVSFKNGTSFTCLDGVVFGHYANDCCYAGLWDQRPSDEWAQFRGRIQMDEGSLAKGLEQMLITNLRIPAQLMSSMSPYLGSGNKSQQVQGGKPIGAVAIKRDVVAWRKKLADSKHISPADGRELLDAEFDLETGELKWISVQSPDLFDALRHAEPALGHN